MSKLPNIGTSIFTVMSKMAAENNAINLSGFPNFPVDDRLTNILAPHKGAPVYTNVILHYYLKLLP
jgi:methionine aminotransferase